MNNNFYYENKKILVQNNNGNKKGFIKHTVNDKIYTTHLRDNEIDSVFEQKIYTDPFSNFNFSKPQLNNYLNNNSNSILPIENISNGSNLSQVDSHYGFNYGDLNATANSFNQQQNNAEDFYDKFFRFRGGNAN